jgi:ribosomal protein S18 acetylase RimI-like enzyme
MTEIRQGTPQDINGIVEVHDLAFPGFYLTLMGKDFLRAYYSSVLEYPKSQVLVATSGQQLVGFAVGFLDPSGFYSFFKARRWRYLPLIALALLRRPSLVVRTLSNSQRIGQVQHSSTTLELSSIAVRPETRGVGSLLLQAFLEQAQQLSAQEVVLTTDAIGNDTVNRFYVKHGFLLQKTFLDGTRQMNAYVRPISPR